METANELQGRIKNVQRSMYLIQRRRFMMGKTLDARRYILLRRLFIRLFNRYVRIENRDFTYSSHMYDKRLYRWASRLRDTGVYYGWNSLMLVDSTTDCQNSAIWRNVQKGNKV